jgi:hypothetical protein
MESTGKGLKNGRKYFPNILSALAGFKKIFFKYFCPFLKKIENYRNLPWHFLYFPDFSKVQSGEIRKEGVRIGGIPSIPSRKFPFFIDLPPFYAKMANFRFFRNYPIFPIFFLNDSPHFFQLNALYPESIRSFFVEL